MNDSNERQLCEFWGIEQSSVWCERRIVLLTSPNIFVGMLSTCMCLFFMEDEEILEMRSVRKFIFALFIALKKYIQ